MASDSQVELLSSALDLDLLSLHDDPIDQCCKVIAAKVRVGVFELLCHQPPETIQQIWTDLAFWHGLPAHIVKGRLSLFPFRLRVGDACLQFVIDGDIAIFNELVEARKLRLRFLESALQIPEPLIDVGLVLPMPIDQALEQCLEAMGIQHMIPDGLHDHRIEKLGADMLPGAR